ncbi:hypothetical protein G4V62_02435 [Bacillaceae bacterium SIJ1]|uniref:hypothetical protein n=1 Tax=Litoribacterium kuwaitense TaxID=1398745 RepID=UPI0013EB729E|nr:hypothetical protein [Litoribacterium kuwaitense]NGP43859.1 hypothetical protein [Litoribacterium kuwaitense]
MNTTTRGVKLKVSSRKGRIKAKRKPYSTNFKNRGVGVSVCEKSISQIESELGLDKLKPIQLSADDQEDADVKGDTFRDLYEEELRNFYES